MATYTRQTVTHVHHWSDRTFTFRCTRDRSFRFAAGEFVMIGLEVEGRAVLRAYSVTSAPWEEELEFLSIKIADGELTSRLQHIQVGDTVLIGERATGTLRNEALAPGRDLWMLATGTGLAPFMSLVRDLDTIERWQHLHVVHSVRHAQDLAYHSQLAEAFVGEDLHDLVSAKLIYHPVVTGEGAARIGDQLKSGQLELDPDQDRVMLCGNLEFNHELAEWCRGTGMTEGLMRRPGGFVLERAFVEK
jgi:ferredoxin--NADP+ reductase